MTVPSEHTTTVRSFKHLSLSERGMIFALLREARSIRYIVASLQRSPSTIVREIRRGTTKQLRTGRIPCQSYFPETGQAVYDKHRLNSRKMGKERSAATFLHFAESKILTDKWSVDAVVGYCRNQPRWQAEVLVCSKTLYHYIDCCRLAVRNIDLPLKVRRKSSAQRNGRTNAFSDKVSSIDPTVFLPDKNSDIGKSTGLSVAALRMKHCLLLRNARPAKRS